MRANDCGELGAMTPPEDVKSCAHYRCDDDEGDLVCPWGTHSTRQYPDRTVNVMTSTVGAEMGNTMFDVDPTEDPVVCEETVPCTECVTILNIDFCLKATTSDWEPGVSVAVLEPVGNPCQNL